MRQSFKDHHVPVYRDRLRSYVLFEPAQSIWQRVLQAIVKLVVSDFKSRISNEIDRASANRTRYGSPQEIASMKFQCGHQSWRLGFKQCPALNVSCFCRMCGGRDGIFGVAEVAASFLGDSIHAGVKRRLPIPTRIPARRWLRRGPIGVIVE